MQDNINILDGVLATRGRYLRGDARLPVGLDERRI
jgi:hypothetical protein